MEFAKTGSVGVVQAAKISESSYYVKLKYQRQRQTQLSRRMSHMNTVVTSHIHIETGPSRMAKARHRFFQNFRGKAIAAAII